MAVDMKLWIYFMWVDAKCYILWHLTWNKTKVVNKLSRVRSTDEKSALKSSTIDKLGKWCLERRVRPRIKPSRMHRVSMTTLWAAATHPALSHWQVSGNTNTYHILTKARGRGRPGIKSQRELSKSNNKTQMTWHPKPSCKPCGAPAQNPRPPHTRTLGDTAGQHCLAFNLA